MFKHDRQGEDFLYKAETFKIIGLCMEIHRTLGHGFLEVVYKEALEIEFVDGALAFEREKEYKIPYKHRLLQHKFYADFLILNKIILEVKAVENGLSNEHVAQVLNYLKTSGCKIGLLINFGKHKLEYCRIMLS